MLVQACTASQTAIIDTVSMLYLCSTGVSHLPLEKSIKPIDSHSQFTVPSQTVEVLPNVAPSKPHSNTKPPLLQRGLSADLLSKYTDPYYVPAIVLGMFQDIPQMWLAHLPPYRISLPSKQMLSISQDPFQAKSCLSHWPTGPLFWMTEHTLSLCISHLVLFLMELLVLLS